MAKRQYCGPLQRCCDESVVVENATHRVARRFPRLEPTQEKLVKTPGGRLTINLYPFGCRKDGEERFEKYRGAWGLLEKA